MKFFSSLMLASLLVFNPVTTTQAKAGAEFILLLVAIVEESMGMADTSELRAMNEAREGMSEEELQALGYEIDKALEPQPTPCP